MFIGFLRFGDKMRREDVSGKIDLPYCRGDDMIRRLQVKLQLLVATLPEFCLYLASEFLSPEIGSSSSRLLLLGGI
jgi:hypothetical protein